jgi:chemotaxis protein MotB
MKHYYGNTSMTAVSVLILVVATATGWFYYYDETVKNESLIESHQRKQASLTKQQDKLSQLLEQADENKFELEVRLQKQTRRVLSSQTELLAQLETQQNSQAELTSSLEKSRSENRELDERMQEADDQALSKHAELQNSALKLTALLEKSRNENRELDERMQEADDQALLKHAELQNSQVELTTLLEQSRNENRELDERMQEADDQALSKHTELQKSQDDLNALLAQARKEKSNLETRLQAETNSAQLTTAELESELQKRQSAEKSLLEEITVVSGQKTELQIRLEREQASKEHIENLKTRLEQELSESRVEISQLKNSMTVIKLTSEVLFNSGSAEIKSAGKEVLSIIAESLNAYPQRAISIEGHTDSRPVAQNSGYSSNWALSAARSLSAVNFLQLENQVDPQRLRLVGYGEYQPVSDNDKVDGRQQNRRIEIKLLPLEPAEPN